MDEGLEGGRDGRRGEQRQGGKMEREEEVSGGVTGRQRERQAGGRAGTRWRRAETGEM